MMITGTRKVRRTQRWSRREDALVEMAAERAGKTLSAWIRSVAVSAARRELGLEEEEDR